MRYKHARSYWLACSELNAQEIYMVVSSRRFFIADVLAISNSKTWIQNQASQLRNAFPQSCVVVGTFESHESPLQPDRLKAV